MPRPPAPNLRFHLAAAIAAPGARARELRPDNTAGASYALAAAAKKDIPFFVPVRDQVLALDGDHDRGGMAAVRSLSATLRGLGHPPVIVSSGGHERFHVFAVVPDPAIKARLADQARHLGFDVRRDIRPPLARHRSAGRSRLYGITPEAALARLSESPSPAEPTGPPAQPSRRRTTGRSRRTVCRSTDDSVPRPPITVPAGVDERTAVLINTGRPDVFGYGSRSERDLAVMCGLVRAGLDLEQCTRIFEVAPCGGRYRNRNGGR